jgi:uncharacterized membrane protein required for colicin V production
MGLFDLFTIAVAVAGYLVGRSRGLVWQASGVGTLVLGGLCATVLCRPLGSVFADGILGRFVAWVVVYVVVAVCLYVLTLKLKGKIKELEFDELDKRFGGMIGSFKGLLAFAVVTLVAVALSDGVRGAVKASATGQSLSYLVHQFQPLLPEKIHDAFGPYLDRVHPDVPTQPSERPVSQTPSTQRPGQQPRPPVKRPQPPVKPPIVKDTPVPRTPTPVKTPSPDPVPITPLEPPVPPATPVRDTEPDPFDTTSDPPDPLAPRD